MVFDLAPEATYHVQRAGTAGRDLAVVFQPTPTASLVGYGWTRNHLLLSVLEDVRQRVEVLSRAQAGRR